MELIPFTNIYLKRLFETNPMEPNMAGFNKVENMITSFQVFDAYFCFWRSSPYPNIYAFPNLKRKFKAVLGDKSFTSDRER